MSDLRPAADPCTQSPIFQSKELSRFIASVSAHPTDARGGSESAANVDETLVTRSQEIS
ncbi:MAG: hypothetical protein QY326_05815 [Bdellovibrionota bacterium]|nr:MAG: hypothetical protein QY326_05815 [Bdellovibrionota bacterium]